MKHLFSASFIAGIFVLALAQAAHAQAAEKQTVIRDNTTTIPVALNLATVKCSRADYAMPMLKVLIPGLADLTVLNHRNTKEGAPCVSAGSCQATDQGPGHLPKEILKSGDRVEDISVRVVLSRVTVVEPGATTCSVYLKEEVFTTIGGLPFYHMREQPLPDRKPADCP